MHFTLAPAGCSVFGVERSFYPHEVSAKQMLGFYSQRFRTVEINNTFYRTCPTAGVAGSLGGASRRRLPLCAESPSRITHKKRLALWVSRNWWRRCRSGGTLKERLGPLLFSCRRSSRRMYRYCVHFRLAADTQPCGE